jgi:outer membrane protein assembly factor BamB
VAFFLLSIKDFAMKTLSLCLLLACQSPSFAASADSWPQFLGPARDGVYSGPALADTWSNPEPRIRWKIKVGEGFAGPVCAEAKVLIFHRQDNQEKLTCLAESDGARLWEISHPTHYRDDFGFDEGPRSTPAINEGRVYTLGAEGIVECVQFNTGKRLWSVDSKKQYGAGKGFFGMACSPLVQDGLVLLSIGGQNGAGIIALDKKTGSERWKSTDYEAGYSSPVGAKLAGKDYALFFTRNGLSIIDPLNGKVVVDYPWRSKMNASVNAATPLVIDDEIFLSASYGTGAILLQWNAGRLTKVWSADEVISNHYASSVYHDGYLYGFDGRQEYGPGFVCVEFKTGKLKWRKENFGAGTVTLAGDKLLILKESGELLLCPADPQAFQVLGRTQILGTTVRAYPALAAKHLYARDKSYLVRVDLP